MLNKLTVTGFLTVYSKLINSRCLKCSKVLLQLGKS